jgi:hypothetical protein
VTIDRCGHLRGGLDDQTADRLDTIANLPVAQAWPKRSSRSTSKRAEPTAEQGFRVCTAQLRSNCHESALPIRPDPGFGSNPHSNTKTQKARHRADILRL